MAGSALIKAVKENDFQQVYNLLESGADVHEKDETYSTALHYAVDYKCNNLNIIKLLIQQGADVHAINKIGTPLDIAVRYPKGIHAVQVLLAADANPNFIAKPGQYERQTPLHYAAVYGTSEIIKLLVKKGANPNVLDGAGNAPLHWAVSRYEVVETLLSCGAYPAIAGPSGMTPLHVLVTMGDEAENVATAELLIKKGAQVNATDKILKQTPFHLAAKDGCYRMCRCLLQHGAQPLLKDAYGKLPGQLVPEQDRPLFDSFSSGKFDTLIREPVVKKPAFHLTSCFVR